MHTIHSEGDRTVEEVLKMCEERKLKRDYNKLSEKTRKILEDRYKNIINVLFVN